ncbi:sorbosone dehydrogenase family protein [Methylomonas sp. AM2-LC]|uniref:PQQ-dependent sugar dehydrogenase n=1 Tax=Methylomonas sp. AM2-LC TaxID=3153301 RepID=UPI003267E35B
MYPTNSLLVALVGIAITACGDVAQLPVSSGVGPHPQLPPPNPTLISTINIATAKGWPVDGKPLAAAGLTVNKFAGELDHPRWLYVLPNGDVLVAETNAPPKPEDGTGIKGWIMKWVMKKAGAGVASANRITLLRDIDSDGVAETRSVFIEGLNSPFGMALVGNDFYVANTDAIIKYPYIPGQPHIDATGIKVLDLPAGLINHHWTKNLLSNKEGSRLYVTVGSNSNVAENGISQEDGRASIWEFDLKQKTHRVYATGLRNPNGLAWGADGVTLWTVVNERDELGSDLVPDYLTTVVDGGFYGWPYSYFGQQVDERIQAQRPDLVAKAIMPDYALGPHTASLGLAYSNNSAWPTPYLNGVFIGQHGSWNRKPRSGYRVIFIPFSNGKPIGDPLEVLTGFVSTDDEAFGRPVGVAMLDRQIALLVADDVGNIIWRVTASNLNSQTSKMLKTDTSTGEMCELRSASLPM